MKKVWLCNFKFGLCKKKTISNDDHFLISPPKMKICNPHITVFELWLCVLPQYKAQVLAVHSRETRNDSNETRRVSRETRRVSRETRRVSRETRRVSRETRRVSREGGNLHLSGTVNQPHSENGWAKLATLIYASKGYIQDSCEIFCYIFY